MVNHQHLVSCGAYRVCACITLIMQHRNGEHQPVRICSMQQHHHHGEPACMGRRHARACSSSSSSSSSSMHGCSTQQQRAVAGGRSESLTNHDDRFVTLRSHASCMTKLSNSDVTDGRDADVTTMSGC